MASGTQSRDELIVDAVFVLPQQLSDQAAEFAQERKIFELVLEESGQGEDVKKFGLSIYQ